MMTHELDAVIEQLRSRHETSYWMVTVIVLGLFLSAVACVQAGFAAPKFIWTAGAIAWTGIVCVAVPATIVGAVWGARRDAITRI